MPVRPHPNRPKRFRARYRIRNWPQYEAGLKRRGDLTLWLEEATIAEWQAPRRTTSGGQARYSDLAIGLVLILRLVFHLALRQAEGFARSVLRLLSGSSGKSRGYWRASDAGLAAWTVSATMSPAEGVTMGVPVDSCLRNRIGDILPSLEALPGQRQ